MTYTFTLTAQQEADVAACVTQPAGPSPFKTVDDWLQAQVASLVQQCTNAQHAQKVSALGILSVSDLTPSDLAAIKAARGI